MIVELSRLKPGGERLEGEEPEAILDLEPGAPVRAVSPIRYTLLAELLPGELVVRGSLSCRIAFPCSRCAKIAEREVRVPDFLCVRAYRDSAEAIDLTAELREDMILAFPNYPVCSPTCRGLCPQCGADLNERSCDCRREAEHPAWSALDRLNRME